MKEKIKIFFKRHFTKIALAVSAFALAISCLSTPTYAYTMDDNGTLVSDNIYAITQPSTLIDNGTIENVNNTKLIINGQFNSNIFLSDFVSLDADTSYYVYNCGSSYRLSIQLRRANNTFSYTSVDVNNIVNFSTGSDPSNRIVSIRIYLGVDSSITYNNAILSAMVSKKSTLGFDYEPVGQTYYNSTQVNQIITDQVAQQNIIKPISSTVYLTRINGITTDLGANRSGLFSDFAYDDDIVKVQYVFDRQVDLNTLLIDLFWTHDIGGNYIQSVVTDKGYTFDISNLTEENHYIYSDEVAKCNSITIYFTKTGNLYNFNSSLWLRFTQNNSQYYQSFFQSGYNSGYNEASSMIIRDYENRLSELYEQFEIEKDQAYTQGHRVGLSQGRAESSSGAYEAGYAAGRAEVPADSTTNFKDVIWTIATTPFESFKTIWNVDLLGVNIAAFFTAIITLGLGIFIIKKIL